MPLLPRVGDTFGRYRIDTQIGRGGMGVVFGATDTSFNRTVALKVVSASLGDSAEFQQRFQREASVLARLDSPHVIAIYDYGVENECPYIATQYVAGGDLGGLIRARGAMPPHLALSVCAQVADALYDAHRVGVVHRDVKPGNVLLRDADASELHAYLCDFGIARTESDGLTTPGQVAGTWSYLAPECGRGQPGTPASDIYALGCLLWVTLTGSPPYRGSDIEVAVAHQEAPVPQIRAVDEAGRRLNEVLARSMAKRPVDRYADADQLRTAMLGAIAAGLAGLGGPSGITPVPSLPPGGVGRALSGSRPSGSGLSLGTLPPYAPPPRRRRSARSRAALVTAAACAGVLLVAAGVFGVVKLSQGDGATPVAGPTDSGTASPTDTTTPSPTPTRLDEGGLITGDDNGDGLGDFRMSYDHYLPKQGSGSDDAKTVYDNTTWTSTGSSFDAGKVTRTSPGYHDGEYLFAHLFGDFDGDEVLDEITVMGTRKPADHYTITGQLSGGASVDASWFDHFPGYPVPVVADVDGDGNDDVVFRLYRSYKVSPSDFVDSLSDGQGHFGALTKVGSFPTSLEKSNFLVGDFDGDGRADLAQVEDLGNTKNYQERYRVTIHTGTGTGFTDDTSKTFKLDSCCGLELGAADLDGDEDDEVVIVEPDTATTIDSLDLKNDKLKGPEKIGLVPGAHSSSAIGKEIQISDVNGDGLDDVVIITAVTNHKAVIRAAVSNGSTLTASQWATWDFQFHTSKYYESFDTGNNPL